MARGTGQVLDLYQVRATTTLCFSTRLLYSWMATLATQHAYLLRDGADTPPRRTTLPAALLRGAHPPRATFYSRSTPLPRHHPAPAPALQAGCSPTYPATQPHLQRPTTLYTTRLRGVHHAPHATLPALHYRILYALHSTFTCFAVPPHLLNMGLGGTGQPGMRPHLPQAQDAATTVAGNTRCAKQVHTRHFPHTRTSPCCASALHTLRFHLHYTTPPPFAHLCLFPGWEPPGMNFKTTQRQAAFHMV